MTATPPGYVFQPDTSAYVGIQRGRKLFIGKLDAAGNFLPDEDRWKGLKMGSGLSGVPDFQIINARRPGRVRVYEYRSGRLIKGELDDQGNFVPEAGSQVIDFKDYHYGKDALPIYNLPGKFVPTK